LILDGPLPARILNGIGAMLKVDLHTHTADDPIDRIPHTTVELVDRAAALGYGAIAVTLHERQLDPSRFDRYAAERGIVLVRGVERTIEGRHVLLLNFSRATEAVRSFDDLSQLKARERGLVVAPHPFFPSRVCLRGDLDRHRDLFDAVERNGMIVPGVDFNRAAEAWAARHGKPVVGNGDVHRLAQLGATYSLVDAPPDADAICEAIHAGHVRVESRPLSYAAAARVLGSMLLETVGWPGRAELPDAETVRLG
jgi:predicted metal-dependent phosphoesterase TrpH